MTEKARVPFYVMAGQKREALDVPAIHVMVAAMSPKRGCPGPQTSLRSLRKADCYARE
jgi:hypothetical protein